MERIQKQEVPELRANKSAREPPRWESHCWAEAHEVPRRGWGSDAEASAAPVTRERPSRVMRTSRSFTWDFGTKTREAANRSLLTEVSLPPLLKRHPISSSFTWTPSCGGAMCMYLCAHIVHMCVHVCVLCTCLWEGGMSCNWKDRVFIWSRGS